AGRQRVGLAPAGGVRSLPLAPRGRPDATRDRLAAAARGAAGAVSAGPRGSLPGVASVAERLPSHHRPVVSATRARAVAVLAGNTIAIDIADLRRSRSGSLSHHALAHLRGDARLPRGRGNADAGGRPDGAQGAGSLRPVAVV